MDQFVIRNLQAVAFVTDAYPKTHPMNYDAATPAQIHSLFNNIAYQKGKSATCCLRRRKTETIISSS